MPSDTPRPAARPVPRGGLSGAGIAFALIAAASAPAHAQEGGGARSRALSFTVNSSASYVDTQRPAGVDGRDLVLDVRPGVQYSSRSGRVQGSLQYNMGLVRYIGDTDAGDVQHTLDAAFTAEAVPNWFYVDATAGVVQSALSPVGQQSAGSSLQRNRNRTEVASASLSPYVRGPLGSFATYNLRLNARAVNTRRSIAGDSTSSGAVAAIDSAGAGSLLGWGLLASSDRSSFRRGRTTVNERVQARLSLSPDPELRLALRGGQETTDAITVDKQRYANWGFDAQWTPNERTQASLTTDRRYFGQSHQFSFTHRLPQTAWTFLSSKSASNNADPNAAGAPVSLFQLLMAVYASALPDPVLREQFVLAQLQQNNLDPNTAVLGGFVNSGLSVQRRNELAWTYTGRRTTLGLQGFGGRTSQLGNGLAPAPANGDVRQSGYTSSLAYRLTPTATATVVGQRLMTREVATDVHTDLKSLGLTLTEQIGRRANASLGARYSVFNSPTDPYRESSVTASLSLRF